MIIAEEFRQRCIDNLIPMSVYFELTQRCNLRCKHCYIPKYDGAPELSPAEIKAILDQLVQMGTFYITFTGGESLLRQDFFEIAAYARQKGFLITLITNGTLIGPDEADKIKELKPLGVYVSLLGATAEVHDSITQVTGSFACTIEAIKLLVARDAYVVANTTLIKQNLLQHQQIKSLAKQLGAQSRIMPFLMPCKDGSPCPMQYDLSPEDVKKYLSDEVLMASYLLENKTKPTEGLTCPAGKIYAAISPCGDVWPCITMPIALGNLRHNRFAQIWYATDNELWNQLRSITEADLTTCSNCQLASFCIRCPGMVYLETKSLVKPSPSACKYAQWRASFVAQSSCGALDPPS